MILENCPFIRHFFKKFFKSPQIVGNPASVKSFLSGGFVKLVYIVVRPSKVEVVKSALSAIKINGATLFDVRGFGSSKGHTSSYRGSEYVTDTNPKGMLMVACNDDDVPNIIEAVRDVANTGSIGDGKIFVNELTDVIRIRTGETGEDALLEKNDD